MVIVKDGKILLLRRSAINDVLPGYWDIPGGTLEDGEDPAVGALRETKEESGLVLSRADLFFQKSNVDTGKNKQFITLVFMAKHEKGDVVLNPEEHDAHAWVSIEEALGYKTVDYMNDCLQLLSSKKHSLLCTSV